MKSVSVLGLRIELEQETVGSREWWRARVTGGVGWGVECMMPWSYAPKEDQATGDAVVAWTRIHVPGPTLAAVA